MSIEIVINEMVIPAGKVEVIITQIRGPRGADGIGALPPGGVTKQKLTKLSDADGDAGWQWLDAEGGYF